MVYRAISLSIFNLLTCIMPCATDIGQEIKDGSENIQNIMMLSSQLVVMFYGDSIEYL